ncbi:N-6 DNA methylase [Syntrophobacteraceae bacterium DRH4]|nr:N-6 DNA methylase [Desulfoferrobacter suflitae]MCK8603799.1 N-6 DNA methylase [Desulfoferrobacter suflitae]
MKATPKEKTLQMVARSLSGEYGFRVEDMERDFKVAYLDPNTGKTRRMTLSLVVFGENLEHVQENIIRTAMILPDKTKATDKKNGINLLYDALGSVAGEQSEENPGCAFGLWTNGSELYYVQKRYEEHEPDPIFEEISDFPGKDESLEDLDRPDRQMLRIAAGESLLSTFKRCHDYIYGNQGKVKTAFWELLYIIFCKIYDERRREICQKNGETFRRRFWVGVKERNTQEGLSRIEERIRGLFEEVKQSDEYSDVFSGNETISLNDRVLAYIAGEMSRYSFLDASVDAKGMAYEAIVSNTLKQERGQFFTPRNIVRLMVQMMDPAEKHYVLDPACGSGGFLVMVLDHVRRKIARHLYPEETGILLSDRANSDPAVLARAKKYAQDKLFGIDFDDDLKKAARMNMVMSGDGHGNIFCLNSLQYPDGADKDLDELKECLRERQAGLGTKSPEISLGYFDFVFTNPPFGAKIPIDDPEILKNYDLGYRWSKLDGKWRKTGDLQSSQPPEILFIERCFQFLREGGKMAIVLPDGILGNPDLEYVRYWILQNTKVLASIDLPVEAFLPQVGVQASLLFLQRKTYEEKLMTTPAEYDVFMAIAEKVGKDRRGNPIYVRDEDGAELVFPKVIEELRKDANGNRKTKELKIYERQIDDDLPKVLTKWKDFLHLSSKDRRLE